MHGAMHGFGPLAVVAATLVAGCAAAPPHDDEIGTAVYVGGAMVREYDPEPALRTPAHAVDRARYPATDVHCHWELRQDPAEMLEAMDALNIERAVNLSGGWGERLASMLGIFHGAAPDRLLVFCNIDFSRVDEPDFGPQMSRFLREARAAGASGLKVFKDLGLRIRDGSGALLAIDDPRLDPIWATCGELDMPVLIHTADPAAFFEPVDERNERWMQLQRHPDWSFAGPEYPTRDTLFAQRDRMLERHRGTSFIGAHVGSHAGDLATAAAMLDRHPNLFYDISGRVAELGRQPYAARRFLIDYQDRILYGTDRYPGRPDQPRDRVYFRFLETADEYFDYYDHPFPPTGEWKIYGVHLPDAVLEKIYAANASRLLAGSGR